MQSHQQMKNKMMMMKCGVLKIKKNRNLKHLSHNNKLHKPIHNRRLIKHSKKFNNNLRKFKKIMNLPNNSLMKLLKNKWIKCKKMIKKEMPKIKIKIK